MHTCVRMYRFWDFDRDENYTIDVASVTPVGTTASSVACVHADPNHGTCILKCMCVHVVNYQI